MIGLAPGMVFVDMGCGDGYFALPATRKVGNRGRVYAVDIDADAIARLREQAEREGLKNIVARTSETETAVVCEGCAIIVFTSAIPGRLSAMPGLCSSRPAISPISIG